MLQGIGRDEVSDTDKIEFLLEEIERLEAEISRLEASWDRLNDIRKEKVAKIERLEATVDRLEAELKDTVPIEYHDALVWGFQRMILELESVDE